MISLKIHDIKNLMQILLYESETTFDDFLLSEACVKMAATFSIDGHKNKDFYENDDINESDAKPGDVKENMVYWRDVKSNLFHVIKGKKTPSAFNIVLYLNKEKTAELIDYSKEESGITLPGLMLRLNYSGNELFVLTGTVNSVFTLDKSIDLLWDKWVREFFTNCQISFDEQ